MSPNTPGREGAGLGQAPPRGAAGTKKPPAPEVPHSLVRGAGWGQRNVPAGVCLL